MTSGEAPSGPSVTKVGGIALIGVGLLAGVFGVATAVSGGQDQAALPSPGSHTQPPPATRETSQPGEPSTTSQPSTNPPASETRSEPTPGKNPGETQGKDPGKTPGQEQGTGNQVVVRVYNNSTIKGLAHDAAADFRRAGFEVPEVGNYSAGRIYTTTVYYRPGTSEEKQARQVAERFGARLEPRFNGLGAATPGVIAIITNDYKARGEGK